MEYRRRNDKKDEKKGMKEGREEGNEWRRRRDERVTSKQETKKECEIYFTSGHNELNKNLSFTGNSCLLASWCLCVAVEIQIKSPCDFSWFKTSKQSKNYVFLRSLERHRLQVRNAEFLKKLSKHII